MEHTIEVTIDKDGKITAIVQGVAGPVCGDLSRWLDELGEVEHDEPTADYYQQAEQVAGLHCGY